MTLPTYEVFAIKYAERDARRTAHFLGGDPHDGPMPMDYFVWLIRNDRRTIVLDVGFTAPVAERRKRVHLRTPAAGLAKLGVNAATVKDVIVSHMHYDHVGTFGDFPQAKFHLQDDEMAYVTGRSMCHTHLRGSYEVEDVIGFVRMLYDSRVHTQRGWVVLASDASHYYEHFEKGRVFPTVYNVADAVEGYTILKRLAESPQHIVPGHDPLVMRRYPAASGDLEGVAVRLDIM